MTVEIHEDPALQHFVEQSLDKLDQIETALMKLENSRSSSPVIVAQVYGILVSLKESAALLELTKISEVAGAIGHILDRLYKNELEIDSELLNIIIDSFDKLTEMVSNATLSNDYDVRIVTLALEEIGKQNMTRTPPVAPESVADQKQPEPESAPAPAPEQKETVSPVSTPQEAAVSEIREDPEAEQFQEKPQSEHSLQAAKFRKLFRIKKEIDLASNANPLGVSMAVSNTIMNMASNSSAMEANSTDGLKFSLAKRHDVGEESIVIASSSVELLDLTLRLTVSPGIDHVLSYEHGLNEYSRVAALCGVELLRLPRGRNFSPPLDQLVTTANGNTAAVIITNPDIPSGYGVPAEELATMANLLPERTLLIVDEKYVEFAWPEDDYSMVNFLDKAPNLVILRSFSWSFGLKGVGLGYALMSPERAKILEDSRLPVPVSPLNLGAGQAAINHSEFYYSTIDLIIRGRERVQKGLEELGCTVYPSQGNFIMFSSPIPAQNLHDILQEYGFRLSTLETFGLPDLLKVSIGNNSTNRMFLSAMKNIL
ncbi:aminotransferase class I/II-fold pyridoxal phosphate-dependent enzyme [Maridesulfovibrio sp.]|uniref:aminotransferase class I/II-fold pyridoxal phosphate-dependent enzyme n=1 Tax=Maridesulfovibrio sp. TaxID=2795000 RepID=UPI002A18C5B5|nr:aminotransferase class I/II-fold pyridoxal phosphate-dependent enzyme [Maridesulfovibrio sp.]